MNSKKVLLSYILTSFLIVLLLGFSQAGCILDVSLVNQDPYPVSPGENVKVIFQVKGTTNRECGQVGLRILENFPFSMDPSSKAFQTIESGTFVKDYSGDWVVPFTIRIDENAREGTNKLEVELSQGGNTLGALIKSFNIEIEEVQTEFEIHVKDYSKSKQTITLEILNVGGMDVEALSIEIPQQENIEILGNNKNIIGVLDANEYTTTTFQANAKSGNLTFIIKYNDITGTRRTNEEKTSFDATPFTLKEQNSKKSSGLTTTIILLLLAVALIYGYYKKQKNKKRLAALRKKD